MKHVYLLSGAETYYIDRGVEDVLKAIIPNVENRDECLTKIDGDKKLDIGEIITAIEMAPFFSEKNVTLIKNTTLFKARNNEAKSDDDVKSDKKDYKLEKLISSLSNIMETNYVMFTTKDVADKRKKIYKAVAKVGLVLEAEPLRPWQIDNWLNYTLKSLNKQMDKEAYSYFIDVISMLPEISLTYLDNELKKTALYVEGTVIKKKDLQTIMAEPPELSSFALIDAITEKKMNKAMYLLSAQINERKEIALIALLTRQVRFLIRAKFFMRQGLYGKALANPLGLTPYIAQKTGEAAQKFSDRVLEDVFIKKSLAGSQN